MEEKLFEFMTKMYNEITAKLEVMDRKIDSKADKNDIVCLENKLIDENKTLFDGYKQTYEKLVVVEKKVEDISDKLEKQDVEISVIKGGKSAKLV